jgi:hypothetical protein
MTPTVPEPVQPDPRQLAIPVDEPLAEPLVELLPWEVARCSCGTYSLLKNGRWAHRVYGEGGWCAVLVKPGAKPCRCGQSLERVEAEKQDVPA